MKKYDIILVDLNPTKGSEQSGIRSCIIIQNDFANKYARTYVVAIISSVIKDYPHNLIIDNSISNGLNTTSRIDLLQVRTIDKDRIISHLGELEQKYKAKLDEKIKIAFDL